MKSANIVVLVCLYIATVCAQEIHTSHCFLAPHTFPTNSEPFAAVVGDLNHDGNQDIVIANVDSDTVTVFLGDGTGGYSFGPTFYTGSGPRALALGDFNGDGNLDLAVANYDSHQFISGLSVLLGGGDGSFGNAIFYGGGTSPTAVATGDFNGDGNLDIVVADSGSTARLLLGKGDGKFVPKNLIPFQAGAVAAADFNHDGKLDLAFSIAGSTNLYRGNGDGTFAIGPQYAVGGGPLAVADLNKDSNVDIVAINDFGNVDVLLGNGNGTFAAPVDYPTEMPPTSLAIGDFNNDTNPDIAVVVGGRVTVLQGKGDGTFPLRQTYSGNYAQYVAVGDFNNDGWLDMFTLATFNLDAAILLNTRTCH